MALYKERGVNPASGCVPMLLTLPVLFAFYSMLVGGDRAARRAVHRLDPRPVGARSAATSRRSLMGITMFVQQKMTPSTADPMQQKMMMFMPLDVDRHVPVGAERPGDLLDGQQRLGHRPADDHQPADRPAAQRTCGRRRSGSVKSAGGGKTAQAKERE